MISDTYYQDKYQFKNVLENIKNSSPGEAIDKLISTVVMASANCRAYEGVHGGEQSVSYDQESNHPYWSIQRMGLYSSKKLGLMLNQQKLPVRTMYWDLFSPTYQSVISQYWEKRRRVYNDTPTLDEIVNAISKRNTLITQRDIFIYSRSDESQDDYGVPAWYSIYKHFEKRHGRSKALHDSTWNMSLVIFETLYDRSPRESDYGELSKKYVSHRHILE